MYMHIPLKENIPPKRSGKNLFFNLKEGLARMQKYTPYAVSLLVGGAWFYATSDSRAENLWILNQKYSSDLMGTFEYYPKYLKYLVFGDVDAVQMSLISTFLKQTWDAKFVKRK